MARFVDNASASLGLTLMSEPTTRLKSYAGSGAERVTPGEFFTKERELIRILRERGLFQKDPQKELCVWIGIGNEVNHRMGIVSITVDIDSSPDEMADYLLEQGLMAGFKLRDDFVN